MYRTPTGVSVYAVGNNADIAASMGVRTKRVSVLTYVIAALCAAVTGLLLASRIRIGDPWWAPPSVWTPSLPPPLAGTALTGGVGMVAGSIAGAFLIGMLSNMMNILGINHFYQYVLKGLLLVVAMIIYSLSSMVEVKKHDRA